MKVPPSVRHQRDLVLIGAGHCHVQVIKSFKMQKPEDVRVTLINEGATAYYSGMLPACVAGLYDPREIQVDLRPLAQWAQTRFIQESVSGIDPVNKQIFFSNRPALSYDLLSINVGSVTRGHKLPEISQYAIATRPLSRLMQRLQEMESQARSSAKIVVVGGGAAGVELAFAFKERFEKKWGSVSLTLVDRHPTILSGESPATACLAQKILTRKNIDIVTGETIDVIQEKSLSLKSGRQINFDYLIWATGAAAPEFLKQTSLELDDQGFIKVSKTLQTSEPDIFAVGDCIHFDDQPLPKAGVYAVREGPVLTNNLLAKLRGEVLQEYQPQEGFLSLLMTGDRKALMNWKGRAYHGRWVWWWKNFIDRRWMNKFNLRRLDPDFYHVETQKAMAQMTCAGCGSKVGSTSLSKGLDQLSSKGHPRIPPQTSLKDDAAVMDVPPGKRLVQSLDFFRSFVDDPYLLGRISVVHSLSDLYAMGAQPDVALVLATLPYASDQITERDFGQLMAGISDEAQKLNLSIVGGHTAQGAEMAVGLSVTGWVKPGQEMTKKGLQVGDQLVLTKSLGTGTLLAAHMRGHAQGSWLLGAYEMMLQANDRASEIFQRHQLKAVTDITGFGLGGHLVEMLEASHCGARLNLSACPYLEGARQCLEQNIMSSLAPANKQIFRDWHIDGVPLNQAPILFDPQTSGGLLAGVPLGQVNNVLQELYEAGYSQATVIGQVTEKVKSLYLQKD